MVRHLLLAAFFFSSAVSLAAPLKVVVDPGHGGEDTGASFDGRMESHVVLGISRKLMELLRKDAQFSPTITRASNRAVSLPARVHFAEKHDADVFVSIHANSSPNRKSKGMEIYIQNELEPDAEALRLAHKENSMHETSNHKGKSQGDLNLIVSDLHRSASLFRSYQLSQSITKNWSVSRSRVRSEAIKQGPFRVLQQDRIPSVLVEVGFMSHTRESLLLTKDYQQTQIAHAIYNGLKDYARRIQ